ncbi:hypothetical protein T4A_10878 [Trichinella pseudospiralis]|uniref:Uncharacterized protein n=1 Tax=Trichinella pseudospiralis TaxID=6337 RepID=A0A0V1EFU2_TRIPS|nr:hypothetical protein T4A_10878 [Trichinella pseudospiralis]
MRVAPSCTSQKKKGTAFSKFRHDCRDMKSCPRKTKKVDEVMPQMVPKGFTVMESSA